MPQLRVVKSEPLPVVEYYDDNGQPVYAQASPSTPAPAPLASGTANVAQRPAPVQVPVARPVVQPKAAPAFDLNPADPLFAPVDVTKPVREGASLVGEGLSRPGVATGQTQMNWRTGKAQPVSKLDPVAIHDIAAGTFQAMSPLAVTGAAVAPLATLTVLGLSSMGNWFGKAVSRELGASPEWQEVAGDIGAVAGGVAGGGAVGAGRAVKREFSAGMRDWRSFDKQYFAYRKAAENLLGVKPTANRADIDAAWKAKAQDVHPDVNPNPNATEMFKNITAARDFLLEHPEAPKSPGDWVNALTKMLRKLVYGPAEANPTLKELPAVATPEPAAPKPIPPDIVVNAPELPPAEPAATPRPAPVAPKPPAPPAEIVAPEPVRPVPTVAIAEPISATAEVVAPEPPQIVAPYVEPTSPVPVAEVPGARKTTPHDAYIAEVTGYGRKEMLKLLSRGGLKAGDGRSDADLAELLWTHFGQRAVEKRAEPVQPDVPGAQALRVKKRLAQKQAERAAPAPEVPVPPAAVAGPRSQRPDMTINLGRGAHDPVRVVFADPLDKQAFMALSKLSGSGGGFKHGDTDFKNPDTLAWLTRQFPGVPWQAVVRATYSFVDDVKAQAKALPKEHESGVRGALMLEPPKSLRDYVADAIAPPAVPPTAQPPVPPPPVQPVAPEPVAASPDAPVQPVTPEPPTVVASEHLPEPVAPVVAPRPEPPVSAKSDSKAAFEERRAQRDTSPLSIKEADDLEGARYALENYGLGRSTSEPGDWPPIFNTLGGPDARIWLRWAADATPAQLQGLRDLVLDARDVLTETSARKESPFDVDPTPELDTIAARLKRHEVVQQGQGDIFGEPAGSAPAIPPERAPLVLPDPPERPSDLSIEALDAYDKALDGYHDALRALRESAEKRPNVPYEIKDGIANSIDLAVDMQTWSEKMRLGMEKSAAERAAKEAEPEPSVITPSEPPPVSAGLIARKEAEVRSGALAAPTVIKRGDAFDWKGTRYRLESSGDNEVSLRNENGNAKTYNAKAIALIEREAGVSLDRGVKKANEPVAPKGMTLDEAVAALPDIEWRGPKPGTPEFQAVQDLTTRLFDEHSKLQDQIDDLKKKRDKTARYSKLYETIDARIDKLQAKDNETYDARKKAQQDAHDLLLQQGYHDPKTPPEQRLVLADRIRSKRGDDIRRTGGDGTYDILKAEVARRMEKYGATKEEIDDYAAKIASTIIDNPLWDEGSLTKQLASAWIRIPEKRAENDIFKRFDALVEKYDASGSKTDRARLGQSYRQDQKEDMLKEFEAKYKGEKDAKDYAEKQRAEKHEERLRADAENAKTLAERGKLVWRLLGAKSADPYWAPVAGDPVVLPHAPKGATFSVFKDPLFVKSKMKDVQDGPWKVIEDSTGLAVGGRSSREDAVAHADENIEKYSDQMDNVLKTQLEKTPAKPELRNVSRPKKSRAAKPVPKPEPSEPKKQTSLARLAEMGLRA